MCVVTLEMAKDVVVDSLCLNEYYMNQYKMWSIVYALLNEMCV